ncbi:UxaA family hydrolase [Desulfoluna butyratoxydans]|uniref:Saf domain n=1 Tax=Desulfoluna butyratoxydans TaxID=231438 RepID=A0A4U8YIL0_9BACT|nr:UxaA family hydrolase [Desulfoluna butyratoxydans]VFQ43094.1 saf domain [Desulfoluna butyratoxydans]
MANAMIMAEPDNVATVLSSAAAGSPVELIEKTGGRRAPMEAGETIPAGNKIALEAIPKGRDIIKYGVAVGYASCDIATGTLVHVHNVRSHRIDIPDSIIDEILNQMGLKQRGNP